MYIAKIYNQCMNSKPVLLARDRYIEKLLSIETGEDSKVEISIRKGKFDSLTCSGVRCLVLNESVHSNSLGTPQIILNG